MRIGDPFPEYSPIHRRRHDEPSRPGAGDDDAPPRRLPREPREERRRTPREEPRPTLRSGETAAERLRRRRALRRREQRPLPLGRMLLSTLVLAGVLLLAFPYALALLQQGRALPGVSVQGIAVDGLDRSAIEATLEERHAPFLQQPVLLHYAEQTWQPTLDDLGVAFDLGQVSAAAAAYGMRGDPFTRLGELWHLWQQGVDLTPVLALDRRQMQDYLLTEVATEINQPPRDARLNIARSNVISVPGVDGRQVLVDETANDIAAALPTLAPHEIAVRTRLLEPVIPNAAALAAEAEVNALLDTPLLLRHQDESWLWNREQLARLVRVEPVGHGLDVSLDAERLRRDVEGLAQELDSGSVEPRMRFANGALQIIQPGRVGWRLQQAPALDVISTTLRRDSTTTRTVQLPVDTLRPKVEPEDLASLGIHELLGEGRSSFVGSAAYRITNIKAGAARLDGVLIAPGEEFSFNTQLGEVNAENGFVEGYAVVGNRTKLEWGGGVCQDSTTVFRAAFWAGLPITERHAHPFYISWYDRYGLGAYGDGAGLDAAIYTGLNDLKFVNDTGNWMLMQVNVDERRQVMTVQLYGNDPDDRQVSIDGPYVTNITPPPATPVYIEDSTRPAGYFAQSDAARSGRDITIYRIVTENGVEVSREPFFTHFKAWPNVFVRGTG
jgi:vancomycin resistance protein YoaR